MNITVWNERSFEEQGRSVKKAYPHGMSASICDIFTSQSHKAVSAWQSQPEQGVPQALLDETDVLIYWAHGLHEKVEEETVARIVRRVEEGMGVIFLHSAHFSKPFQRLMGTSGSLVWREDNKHERLYNINPEHPIANGIPPQIFIPKDEMYGEPFDIPKPDDVIFVGWYPCGELFRSGFTYHYGKGRIFYFQPGHETFPVYEQTEIRKIIWNAALWTQDKIDSAPYKKESTCSFAHPLERNIKLSVKKERN